jgi:uncharacterized protein (TIGR02147 family)
MMIMIRFNEVISKAFEHKKQSNSQYSMRALARDMGISVTYVSKVLSGKNVPSAKFLRRMNQLMDLSNSDLREIYLSICYESLPTVKCQEYFLHEINKDSDELNTINFEALENESIAILSKWYTMAILQLMALKDFQFDLEWIASRLNISVHNVAESIALLSHHNLVEEKNGQLIKSHKRVAFNTDSASKSFSSFQKQMFNKVIGELEKNQSAVDLRSIHSLTVATNSECFNTAKNSFQDSIIKFFELLQTDEPTDVYQLCLGVVPLTNKAEQK